MSTKQTKSKSRVKNYGEVYTASREVESMINLLPLDILEPTRTFLEPACGNGNFLDAILKKKLIMLKIFHGRDANEYNKYLILTISSLYGVDILEDNVKEARDNLYKTIEQYFFYAMHKAINDSLEKLIKEILRLNIINGNTLTGLDNFDNYLIVNEWNIEHDILYRKEQYFKDVLSGNDKRYLNTKMYDLKQFDYCLN